MERKGSPPGRARHARHDQSFLDGLAIEGAPGRCHHAEGRCAGGKTRYVVCVRIGGPARKHGVGDDDIAHAVRNALRWVEMDDDLTMLIGPASDGVLLGRRKFYRFLA
jgi:hypothetical protein